MESQLPVSVAYWALVISLIGFAGAVLLKIWTNRIDLSFLISEPGPNPKASTSRFQFVVFTFVIAEIYLTLCLESGSLLDVPNGVLILLGLSGGGYVVSKGIGAAHPPSAMPPSTQPPTAPAARAQ